MAPKICAVRMVGLIGICLTCLAATASEVDRLAEAEAAIASQRWDEARRQLLLVLNDELGDHQRQRVEALIAKVDRQARALREADEPADRELLRTQARELLRVARPTEHQWQAFEDLRRVAAEDPLVVAIQRRFRPVWAESAGSDDHGRWASRRVGRVLLRFRLVPHGELLLDGRRLRLQRDCWLSETEITRAGYAALTATSGDGGADDEPMLGLCPEAVEAAVARLAADLPAGVEARLPTPAEWEYAARAGCTGSHLPPARTLAGVCLESDTAQPVGRFPANAFGLYDMQGNAWELVRDVHGLYWRCGGGWRTRHAAAALDRVYPVRRFQDQAALGFRFLLTQAATSEQVTVVEAP